MSRPPPRSPLFPSPPLFRPRTSRDENLRMIAETVAHFKRLGKEVIYDAEHFFDGYRLDPGYTLASIVAAADAGADCVVLDRKSKRLNSSHGYISYAVFCLKK